MKYRKKPVVIDAMQYPGLPTVMGSARLDAYVKFDDWLVAHQGENRPRYRGNTVVIPTLEGEMTAQPGDWIIRGVKGELYPCKPDIFAATYEPAETNSNE